MKMLHLPISNNEMQDLIVQGYFNEQLWHEYDWSFDSGYVNLYSVQSLNRNTKISSPSKVIQSTNLVNRMLSSEFNYLLTSSNNYHFQGINLWLSAIRSSLDGELALQFDEIVYSNYPSLVYYKDDYLNIYTVQRLIVKGAACTVDAALVDHILATNSECLLTDKFLSTVKSIKQEHVLGADKLINYLKLTGVNIQ